MTKQFYGALFLAAFSLICIRPAGAQSAGPRTVGDGTLFLFSPGRSEGYGINSGDIGGQFGTPLYSRHHRLGSDTGIGSSTLQTTSVTAETTPVRASNFVPSVSSLNQGQPSLYSPFQASSGNPALQGYTISPSSGLFSGSGLTSPYSELNTSLSGQAGEPGLFRDLDTVPTFSKHKSRPILPLSGEGEDQLFKKVEPQF